ncbi:universal stress protein [Methyloligella solikamskensis]|uniref:Universal stress protein n=1 Tax=Methyloligella solikamskensis TaxID=1177756 RepID=A0ABW3J8J2_9HYPH
MEGYQEILVHMPLAGGDATLRVGVEIAKQDEAHLTGVASLPESAMLRTVTKTPFMNPSEEEIAKVSDAEAREAKAAEKRFTEAADAAGVTHSWMIGEGDSADVLLQACRLQDLVVVEQSTPGADLLWGPAVQMALSGYPTLVVPKKWDGPVARKHAIVAWNGSVQAAAALRKAMPLLKHTEEVTLLVGPSQETLPDTLRVPAPDPLAYMKRHGVNATKYDKQIPGADAGAQILKIAEEKSADLIVMGAFGRSRFREWVLGGATRHVMANSKIPALMAH